MSDSEQRVALVTSVEDFCGPPAARALSDAGLAVLCHAPGFADDATREEYTEAHPELTPLAEQSPEGLVRTVLEARGRLDVVVSNDVHPAVRAAIEDADLADLRAGLESMLVAPFALARAAVPAMKHKGSGKILFVSSGTPLRGLPKYSMYCAARGATNALTLSLARELARFNIQVNAIAPNFVENPTYFPPDLLADEQARNKILSQIPMGRLGTAEEVGALIAFLTGPGSDFITGRVIPIDGGWA